MKHIINIDRDKCIGCRKCVKDCLLYNIYIKDEKAYIKSQKCIKCGHCVAVCPVNAVSISGYIEEPIDIKNMKRINSQELLNSIISRRSIRQFKDMKVSEAFINKIIEAGRWSPTGRNAQDVSYIVIRDNLKSLQDIAVKKFRRILKIIKPFSSTFKEMEIDDDFFFKKAPLVIVILAGNDVDGALAASNMALMAESLGLGVLYSGFFTYAVKFSHKLKKIMGIKDKKIVTTLVIGYADVQYERSVQKEDALVKYM